MEKTALDIKINETFPGLVVRKDLVKSVRSNAPVPGYVLEYLLGMYCATDDEATIAEGIEQVKEILRVHYVNRNEAELVKSKIKEKGHHKIIDCVSVELNAAGTNALETAATNIAAQIVAPANLASILSGTRSISVTGAQPGFYYSVVYAANLTALATAAEGGRELANADGEVTLPMPATEVGATAGFYRVLVNVQPKVLE